jgi:SMC interacting uncharacterized protein involved in chromosome segregation
MSVSQWVEKGFWSLLCWAVFQMNGHVSELTSIVTELTKEIGELNVQMAGVVQNQINKEKEDGKRDIRMESLEKRVRGLELDGRDLWDEE